MYWMTFLWRWPKVTAVTLINTNLLACTAKNQQFWPKLRDPGLNSLMILNYAQSLTWYRRNALLFFEVIHQISRSHGLKNQGFESNLSKITRPVAAIRSLRFALFTMFPSSYHHEIFQWQKWCLCKMSRSEAKGQGHRGQNPIERNSSFY